MPGPFFLVHPVFPEKDVPVRKKAPPWRKSEAFALDGAPGVNGHGIHGRVRRSEATAGGARSRMAKLERLRSTHRCPPSPRDYSSFPFSLFHLCRAQCRAPPWRWRGARGQGGTTGDGWAGVRGFRGSSGVGWKDRESSLQSLTTQFPEPFFMGITTWPLPDYPPPKLPPPRPF